MNFAILNSHRALRSSASGFGTVVALVMCSVSAQADPPSLREEVSLNGTWEVGGRVPVYGGEPVPEKIYEREVTVPAAWRGKSARVEFAAINHFGEIFINGQRVAEHAGGWLPVAVAVPPEIAPGETFRLRVVAHGFKHPRIVDADGYKMRPISAAPVHEKTGLADDVWLRAYGEVSVEDAFIQPSVRMKELAVEYLVRNSTTAPRTVLLQAETSLAAGGQTATPGVRLASRIILAPGETKTVRVAAPWPDPELWWPDRPALYHLTTTVREGDRVLDTETRRFGFREIWTSGNQFQLNGVRLNLLGDYAAYDPIRERHWPKELLTREGLPRAYAQLKALNLGYLRWHMIPAPSFAFDLADEMGVLLMAESAIYGSPERKLNPMPEPKRRVYVENSRQWLGPWMRARRNHPSVILWGGVNESGPKYNQHHHEGLTVADIRGLDAEMRRHDSTRPIVHSGNADTGTDTVNHHYITPGGWIEPKGDIYQWSKLTRPDKPVGVGEFFQTRTGAGPKAWSKDQLNAFLETHKWWQGVWFRGMRAGDLTESRSKVFLWAHREPDSPRGRLLRNALAPVALFDKEYDRLGIAPYVGEGVTFVGRWPEAAAGQPMERTLTVYNDEFRDEAVTVEVLVKVDGQTVAQGRREVQVPLGHHREMSCHFDVPASGAELEIVRRTSKAGRQTFEESSRFRISGAASPTSGSVPIPVSIRFGELKP